MIESARFIVVEGDRHREDRLAMLDRDHAARGETLAVANTFHVVDDGDFGIAGEEEIGVHRMREPALDRAAGRNECLSDHLTAEHALPANLGRTAAKEIHLERFEIENGEKVLDGGGHEGVPKLTIMI